MMRTHCDKGTSETAPHSSSLTTAQNTAFFQVLNLLTLSDQFGRKHQRQR
jgi:hypothetical protein